MPKTRDPSLRRLKTLLVVLRLFAGGGLVLAEGQSVMHEQVEAWLNVPVQVGLLEITVTNLVFEEIAAAPEAPDAYPAGSGVTARLLLRHSAGPSTIVEFSLLSAPYDSQDTATVAGYRIQVLDARQSPRSAALILRVDWPDGT